jgi:hypothetical protein
MSKLAPLAVSLLVALTLFALAEAVVRLLGIQPAPWPSADLPVDFPQIRNDPLLGPLPAPGWSASWQSDNIAPLSQR